MPQIANFNNLPGFAKGRLFAGTLKSSSGECHLYITGDWRYTSKPQGVVSICQCRQSTGTLLYSVPIVPMVYTGGKTTITFKLYTTAGVASTASNELIDYFVWINEDYSNKTTPTFTENIKFI